MQLLKTWMFKSQVVEHGQLVSETSINRSNPRMKIQGTDGGSCALVAAIKMRKSSKFFVVMPLMRKNVGWKQKFKSENTITKI